MKADNGLNLGDMELRAGPNILRMENDGTVSFNGKLIDVEKEMGEALKQLVKGSFSPVLWTESVFRQIKEQAVQPSVQSVCEEAIKRLNSWKEVPEEPLRKIMVLRQVEVPWTGVKKGDVFRTLEAIPGKDSSAQPDKWCHATSNGYVVEGKAKFGIGMEKEFSVTNEVLNTIKEI